MSNLYQSTTESLESLDAGGPNCALPPLPCKKRRAMDKPKGDAVELGDLRERERGHGSKEQESSQRFYELL